MQFHSRCAKVVLGDDVMLSVSLFEVKLLNVNVLARCTQVNTLDLSQVSGRAMLCALQSLGTSRNRRSSQPMALQS